jgi:hypothetical protein
LNRYRFVATGLPIQQSVLPTQMPPEPTRRKGLRALFTIAGFLLIIVTWDAGYRAWEHAGLFGNLAELYMLVTRKAVT